MLEKKSISRSAFLVSLGSLISLAVGMGSQIVIALLYGADAEMDAYLTALVIPVYLQAVLLSGLSFVFIPAFVEARTTGNEDEAWSMVGTFFWVIGAILLAVAIVLSPFADTIISVSAPGLNPEKAELSSRILRVIVFTIPLSGYAVFTSGIQNARNRFFWPTAAGAAASLGMILVLWLFHDQLGPMALAWGFFLGMLLQATMTTVPVFRHGWHDLIPLNDARIKEMARLILPLILIGVLTSATGIIERYFASGLPDGELSYLGYSAKTSRIFRALLVTSIATVIFPTMSKTYSKNGDSGLKDTLQYGLHLTLAIGFPVLAIMSAVAVPFIEVLFERGAFQHETTLQVARILPIILVGTVLVPMIGSLLTRTYYVKKDTHTVPMVSAFSITIYIGFAKILVGGMGFVGLATAQMIYAVISLTILTILLLYKYRLFQSTWFLGLLLKYGIAGLGVFIIASVLTRFLDQLPSWLQLGIAVLVSGAIYLAILALIDPKITTAILEMAGVHHIRGIFRKLKSLGREKLSLVK